MTVAVAAVATVATVARREARLVAGDLTLRLDLTCGARVTAVEMEGLPGDGLVDRWWCGYEVDGQRWSDDPVAGERPFSLDPAQVTRAGPSRRRAPGVDPPREVVGRAGTPHLSLAKRFTVYPGLPFVRVRYRIRTTGVAGRGSGLSLGMPTITFSDRLVDPFDLAEDTADDGVDLGGGLALPAWRAFADTTGEHGLLVFAAERQTMSRLQVLERGCAFRPPYYMSYSTDVVTTRELRLGLQYQNFGPLDEVDWFIGAYRREHLPALLRTVAGFHARRRALRPGEVLEVSPAATDAALPPHEALPDTAPVRVTVTPGSTVRRYFTAPAAGLEVRGVDFGVPPATGEGVRHTTVEVPGGRLPVTVEVAAAAALPAASDQVLIDGDALATAAAEARWITMRGAFIAGGCAHVARPGGGQGAIRIEPHASGVYDLYAGIAGGVGLKFRVDGDPYWTYVTADPGVDVQLWQPLETLCRGVKEVRLRGAVWDGRGLSVAPHPNTQGNTVLTHVRLVAAATPDESPQLTGRRQFVFGLADTPDVSFELAADSLEEGPWRETFWQHAQHGFDTVYWRVDGQCADFHTKIGTVRYSVPRTHNLYSPISRYYGLALQRIDPLRIAVEEGHRWGLRIFGWMRANNYSGNAVARFFAEHPEWHERRENGAPAPQLCFAVPEVREHKASILREAAAYGLDGLMIDTLRHPPMVGYAPTVVDGFRRRYGAEPPRAPDGVGPGGAGRSGEEWERWFRFRAEYFTQFVRDLRAGLAADGRGDLPIHIRIAPHHFLEHGADLETLVGEGLVDAVLAYRYTDAPLDYESLFSVVRGRVPVGALCNPFNKDPIEQLLRFQADERLGGVGVYESEWSIHVPGQREVLLEVARRARTI